jgi:hypothetical protein
MREIRKTERKEIGELLEIKRNLRGIFLDGLTKTILQLSSERCKRKQMRIERHQDSYDKRKS